jgi:CTP:molybdopterin cytidylyltransferase MocA
MRPVAVRIFHPGPSPDAGPLERWLADARAGLAERHRVGFLAAAAEDVRVVTGPPDDTPFGRRLRNLLKAVRPAGGLVILGSGAIPLATLRDRRAFVAAAGADDRRALANNRYSADIVAVASAASGLAGLPDLPGDNGLPRWLAEAAGYAVADLAHRWRMGIDLDSPLDIVLTGGCDEAEVADARAIDLTLVTARIDAVRGVAADTAAELLVAGRTSASTLAWLERRTASRTRALIEERGLRTRRPGQRAPASALGALLDRDGPGSLGRHASVLGDAAVIDTRVLLAHRLGADEAAWPLPEDRYASDLLLLDRIRDPWLRDLTAAAATAAIPILLGGHTLVGPGLRLVIGT